MSERNTIFISKATPEDDDFVLWLAPKLEAAGYTVFADILELRPGERWRNSVTTTLQDKAIKMLLCCTDIGLSKTGVQEEIDIGLELGKQLEDARFVIPLRLQPYKKLFGIAGLQWVDFIGSWARGLDELLEALADECVPRREGVSINVNWEAYKRRRAIKVEAIEEPLTTTWLEIPSLTHRIRYFQPTGVVDHTLLTQCCAMSEFPAEIYQRGFFTFMDQAGIDKNFQTAGKFKPHSEHDLASFIKDGALSPKIEARDASNKVMSLFRRAWNKLCRDRRLLEYAYSKQLGFHAGTNQIGIGKYARWKMGEFSSRSMLRNIARGKVWHYGVSATPAFWPFPHFKLKARVLFTELEKGDSGTIIEDTKKQHRLRRGVCSGWRNMTWHGRLIAYLDILSEQNDYIALPVSSHSHIQLHAQPVSLISPVSTQLPTELGDEYEESDLTTLGGASIYIEYEIVDDEAEVDDE